jgi:hypothetical protein
MLKLLTFPFIAQCCMADFVKYFASDFFQAGSPNFLRIWELVVQKKNSNFFLPHSSFKALKWFTLAVLEILKNFFVWYIPGTPSPHHFDLNFGD